MREGSLAALRIAYYPWTRLALHWDRLTRWGRMLTTLGRALAHAEHALLRYLTRESLVCLIYSMRSAASELLRPICQFQPSSEQIKSSAPKFYNILPNADNVTEHAPHALLRCWTQWGAHGMAYLVVWIILINFAV